MIIGDDELDAMQAAGLQAFQNTFQLDRLSRLASSTASTWRRPSQSTPIAISVELAQLPLRPLPLFLRLRLIDMRLEDTMQLVGERLLIGVLTGRCGGFEEEDQHAVIVVSRQRPDTSGHRPSSNLIYTTDIPQPTTKGHEPTPGNH